MMKFGIILSLLAVAAASVNYDRHELWRIEHPAAGNNKLVSLLEDSSLDVWGSNPTWTDVRVSPEQKEMTRDIIQSFGFSSKIQVKDVEKLIGTFSKTSRHPFTKGDTRADFDFTTYHTLDEMMTFLDELAVESPYVTLKEVGRTIENRELRTVTLSIPSTETKPVIWVDCGIHAREWVTPITCLYGLNDLVNTIGLSSETDNFLAAYDLVMLPVLNADGYDYTWTTDRLWRKNRNQWPDDECVGVDLNRNYDDGHWGGPGASNRSCVATYHGPAPFSELENQAVRDTIVGLQATTEVKSIFSIHSYSQIWAFVFGWTADLPEELDELYRVSQIGVEALTAVHGTIFTYGPHYEVIYAASGTTVDWGYSIGVVHTYLMELRDTGEFGFLLPEDQIIPTAQETWKGLLTAVMAI